MRITLADYKYKPRDYQLPLWEAFDNGIKRLYTLWHRRSGKDLTWWNILIREGIKQRGLYYHFLPTAVQGRKVIWDGMTNDGLKFLEFIPKGAIKTINGQEMKVTLFNDSIIQVIGTDYYDSVRGTNPRGCVFSEYAYQHPMAWEVVKPILKANGGFAGFDTTPNGNNHAKTLWDTARASQDWFADKLTVNDTKILTAADIEAELLEGMTPEMVQQEYFCSFEAGMVGSFYSVYVQKIRDEGRYRELPITDDPVDIFCDLGKSDNMAIGFIQGNNVIDFYENNLKDIEHYALMLKDKGYRYGKFYIPHDGFAKRLESPQSVAEQFQDFGFRVERVPNISIVNGIQLVRKVLPTLNFNAPQTKILLEALESYRKEYDTLKKTYKDTPVHDWASHSSDMVRYAAVILTQKTTNMAELERLHKDRMRSIQVDEDQQYLDELNKAMKEVEEGREPDGYIRAHEDYLRTLQKSSSIY